MHFAQAADFSDYFWLGLLAPAGTPDDVVVRLADALHYAIVSKEVGERIRAEGSEPKSAPSEELQEYLFREPAQMNRLIRELKIARD